MAGNQSVLKQLMDLRYAADTLGMTVDQYLNDVIGERPQWLNDLDYKERLKNNPDSITRLRPIEDVLADYRAGNELSEAEREMMGMYDNAHPGLLGGMKFGRPIGTTTPVPIDVRRDLGATAYAALSAADSKEITPEESNALILSIGQDMDAAFGKYSMLEDYYNANPDRKAVLLGFVDEEKARTEEAAVIKTAQDAKNAKKAQQYAMSTLTTYAKGGKLDENQTQFVADIKSMPVVDADKDDTYKTIEQSVYENPEWETAGLNKGYTDSTMVEVKRIALNDILATDVKLAKAAGMTLTQYYTMFPEMRKTSTELINTAINAYEEKWVDDGGFFEFLFGANPRNMTGKGVGFGTALVKGAESGGLQFAQGYMGFVRNYFTESDESTVQAWNRQHYGGPMGRAKAKKEFAKAIEGIADPEQKAYWQNYMANVKDIYDLPFSFSDASLLNGLYENKKALKQIESFMLSNGTPAEYGAFVVSSSLVDNTLSMAAAAGTTAITGNPIIGTMVGFGPAAAYQASETGRAAGLSRPARNMIGLIASAFTIATEAFPVERLLNTGNFVRGELNVLKASVMNGGTSYAKKLSAKITIGTSVLASRMIENAGMEMTQETFENILNDTWLNLTGAQNKSAGDILNDATRAGAMAMITSPLLTGGAYFVTACGNIKITDDMRGWAQQFVEKKTAEAMKNPDTVSKVIEANAAADTIDTLANGALDDVDTTAVEKTKEDLKKAETNLAAAKDAHDAARNYYADEMHKCTESFTAMSDEEHDVFLQSLVNAKNAYQSAIKICSSLSGKLKLDQGVLNRLLSGIIANARADAKVNAQAAILSEVAAMRMDANMQKADEIANATVRVEQPSPENVSNEGEYLAQGNESVIMNEGAQGEAGGRTEDSGDSDGPPTEGAGNKIKLNNLEDLFGNPKTFGDATPNEWYTYFQNNGLNPQPLGSKSSLKGIPFDQGGGFRINWGGDRYLQYHPSASSHHGGAYWKLSSGSKGTLRFDMNGNLLP